MAASTDAQKAKQMENLKRIALDLVNDKEQQDKMANADSINPSMMKKQELSDIELYTKQVLFIYQRRIKAARELAICRKRDQELVKHLELLKLKQDEIQLKLKHNIIVVKNAVYQSRKRKRELFQSEKDAAVALLTLSILP